MCQLTIDNNDDVRPVPVPPVTQDKGTNSPKDVNDVPMASEGSSVCIGNILEEDKETQRSKMHKSTLQNLGIFSCEFRKPSKDPPDACFKNFCSFKDVLYEDLCHPSNIFLASWHHILQIMRLTAKLLGMPMIYWALSAQQIMFLQSRIII